MKYKYPLAKPDLSGNELKYLQEVHASGVISHKSKFVELFEQKFAEYIGAKYAVACSSGFTSLILALKAIQIGEGNEVIVPEFTMIATAWAVEYAGAKPVFVDCGDDLNIDIMKIRQKITSKTKAIIPVHVYGRPCNMDEIKKFAWEYNLKIVEDCAEAHGAIYKGQKVGSFGSIGCFSFYGNKIITTGEGGMCVTNNERVYEQLKHYRDMAFSEDHTFIHPKRAFNFRMTGLQAAVGLAQIERIDEFLNKRNDIMGWYDKHLKEYAINRLNGSVLWFYDVLGLDRDKFEANSVETRPFFHPMSQQPMYFNENYRNLNAYRFSQMGFYLPVYTQMTEDDVDRICACLTA